MAAAVNPELADAAIEALVRVAADLEPGHPLRRALLEAADQIWHAAFGPLGLVDGEPGLDAQARSSPRGQLKAVPPVAEFPSKAREKKGDRLRRLRKLLGVSRKKLAKLVRAECPGSAVSRETVVAWESGRQVPDAAQLQALARLYRVSERWVSATEGSLVVRVEEVTD